MSYTSEGVHSLGITLDGINTYVVVGEYKDVSAMYISSVSAYVVGMLCEEGYYSGETKVNLTAKL
jgi:hypothetical protein